MNRFIVSLGVLLSVSACAGEAETAEDPYTLAADELEALSAALEEEMTDEDTADAISDESIGMVSDAVKRGRRGHKRGRMGGHGHRRGRADLLLWYGDLEAIQACRDLADTCTDDDACRSDVMDCVRDVFMDALAALCEEKVAMCEADDAPERPCGRITAVCSGDGGAFGHHFGGDRGSRPDGGDFKPVSRTRDHDGHADGGVSFGSRGDRDDDGHAGRGDWDSDDDGDDDDDTDAVADAGMN